MYIIYTYVYYIYTYIYIYIHIYIYDIKRTFSSLFLKQCYLKKQTTHPQRFSQRLRHKKETAPQIPGINLVLWQVPGLAEVKK